MNAVVTKTRAKTAKRPAVVDKTEPPLVTVADIRQWIGAAEEKLEMAYDAAERGEPIDTLLDHINHNVILEPHRIIQRDDLTQVDVKRVYEKLFPVLACIQGAIGLAESTVLQSTLEEAFTLLDAAQTALDPVNDAVRSLPTGGDAHDFARGRDLAVNMLRECRNAPEASECHRRNRAPGARQLNIVDDYATELLCEPSLLEGFSSVLSGVLSQQGIEPEYFSDVSLSETQAGEPGADGTALDEDEPAPAVDSCAQAASSRGIDEPLDPYCVMHQALEVALAATAAATDMHWGVHSLVGKALEAVGRAQDALNAKTFGEDLHDAASNELAGLLGILRAVNTDSVDDTLLNAVETLVVVAKAQIDADNATHQKASSA